MDKSLCLGRPDTSFGTRRIKYRFSERGCTDKECQIEDVDTFPHGKADSKAALETMRP